MAPWQKLGLRVCTAAPESRDRQSEADAALPAMQDANVAKSNQRQSECKFGRLNAMSVP